MTRRERHAGPFIVTREHRRFVEFADAVRRHATVGLCHGRARVGKTLSARRYARWDLAEPLPTGWRPRDPSGETVYAALAKTRTIFYTPPVSAAMATVRKDLSLVASRVDTCIDDGLKDRPPGRRSEPLGRIELLIIDDAGRLTTVTLEYLRDQFDRAAIGLVLIGMPGIEKRTSRYPQLYSRIGFAHEYPALSKEEMRFALTRHWKRFGFDLDGEDFADVQAANAIIRLTGGNFRLLQRLFVQIERVIRINELAMITE